MSGGRPRVDDRSQVSWRLSDEVISQVRAIATSTEGSSEGKIADELMRAALSMEPFRDDSLLLEEAEDCIQAYWESKLHPFIEFLSALTGRTITAPAFRKLKTSKRIPDDLQDAIRTLVTISPLIHRLRGN